MLRRWVLIPSGFSCRYVSDHDHVLETHAGGCGLLGGTKTLDQGHRLAAHTAVESAAGTAVDKLCKLHEMLVARVATEKVWVRAATAVCVKISHLLTAQVKELVEVNASVAELAEHTLLLWLLSHVGNCAV